MVLNLDRVAMYSNCPFLALTLFALSNLIAVKCYSNTLGVHKIKSLQIGVFESLNLPNSSRIFHFHMSSKQVWSSQWRIGSMVECFNSNPETPLVPISAVRIKN